MRTILFLLCMMLIPGCSSRSAADKDSDVVRHIGQITSKQEVTADEVKNSGLNTRVYASVSSGGGVSIGIGFLVSKILSGSNDPAPIRYEVELLDDESMTIYHDSRDFEVDDCVTISVYPEKQKKPPSMRRSEGAC